MHRISSPYPAPLLTLSLLLKDHHMHKLFRLLVSIIHSWYKLQSTNVHLINHSFSVLSWKHVITVKYIYYVIYPMWQCWYIYNQNMMNLQDRDNLRRKDKRPIPKVSFVRRFDCNMYHMGGVNNANCYHFEARHLGGSAFCNFCRLGVPE